MAKITINDLLEAGVHFGHQTRRRNPKMKPYIYGARHKVTIFDLTITMRKLAEACAFLEQTAAEGGGILFVGTKRQAQTVVHQAAVKTNMYYVVHRWLGGMLTNNQVISTRVKYLKQLQKMTEEGSLDELPNKEASSKRREMAKLERTLGGIASMSRLPKAMVAVDVMREEIAIREARKCGIPIVALVDSNCDPDMVDYVIPGNDDALRSIKIIIQVLTAAITEGLLESGREVNIEEAESLEEEEEAVEQAEEAEAVTPEYTETAETAEIEKEQPESAYAAAETGNTASAEEETGPETGENETEKPSSE